MTIDITEATTRPARRAFVALPYRLARPYPNWVLPLRIQVRELMSSKSHPFFEHAEVNFFLASRNGRVVGRIAAIDDRKHNEVHGENTLHFGFFDCEDDPEVAAALFAKVEEVAQEKGRDRIRGPFNHSVHEEIGLQIDGFDTPNYVMNPGNPDYYPNLVEAQGYTKCVDLFCYALPMDHFNEKLVRMAPKLIERHGLTVRAISKKSLAKDSAGIMAVYNGAWEKNWPWTPASPHEFQHIVDNMAQVADFDYVLVAEDSAGQMIGFSLVIPNINEIFARIPSGRLFPTGLLRLILGARPGRLGSARVVAMGVLGPWRHKGIDAIFHARQYEIGRKKGVRDVELSQVLETNQAMIRTAETVGGHIRMTHRIYEKPVAAPRG